MAILTVTQLNRYVTFKLKEDVHLNGILVRGEISGFTRNQRSGHCYFTLKDAESSVRAVLFRNQANRIRIPLSDGLCVIAAGSATLYERDGAFQLYVTDLQIDGVGQQQAALEQRKKKLTALGVFDAARKKALPPFPQKIGVVTSASGAAIHDIEQVIGRRFPLVQLCLFPAQVQGEAAPQSICRAMQTAAQSDCDILIIGRGGGSVEDLQAFQTEEVVLAVYHCPIPVISAVGHETDETLTDYAADLRAPTPSAAAELAVPSAADLLQQIQAYRRRMETAMALLLQQKQTQFTAQQRTLSHFTPQKQFSVLQKEVQANWHQLQAALHTLLQEKQMQLQTKLQLLQQHSPQNRLLALQHQQKGLEKRLQAAMRHQFQQQTWRLQVQQTALESNNPLRILSNGYAIVYRENQVIRSSESVKVGDRLTIQLAHGTIQVQVVVQEGESYDI